MIKNRNMDWKIGLLAVWIIGLTAYLIVVLVPELYTSLRPAWLATSILLRATLVVVGASTLAIAIYKVMGQRIRQSIIEKQDEEQRQIEKEQEDALWSKSRTKIIDEYHGTGPVNVWLRTPQSSQTELDDLTPILQELSKVGKVVCSIPDDREELVSFFPDDPTVKVVRTITNNIPTALRIVKASHGKYMEAPAQRTVELPDAIQVKNLLISQGVKVNTLMFTLTEGTTSETTHSSLMDHDAYPGAWQTIGNLIMEARVRHSNPQSYQCSCYIRPRLEQPEVEQTQELVDELPTDNTMPQDTVTVEPVKVGTIALQPPKGNYYCKPNLQRKPGQVSLTPVDRNSSEEEMRYKAIDALIKESLNKKYPLNIFENVLSYETNEINKYIFRCKVVMAAALALGTGDTSSHLNRYGIYGPMGVTRVFRLGNDNGSEFREALQMVANGNVVDSSNQPLLLLSCIRGSVAGRIAVIFYGVGNSKKLDLMVEDVERYLDPQVKPVIFRADNNRMENALCVIAFSLVEEEVSDRLEALKAEINKPEQYLAEQSAIPMEAK